MKERSESKFVWQHSAQGQETAEMEGTQQRRGDWRRCHRCCRSSNGTDRRDPDLSPFTCSPRDDDGGCRIGRNGCGLRGW